jgi:hypothetical protein
MPTPKLRPYQEETVRRLMLAKAGPTAVLNTTITGLGKSACAIVAAHRLGLQRGLILAPLATLPGWQREARLWSGGAIDPAIVRRKDRVPTTGWVLAAWSDLHTKRQELRGAGPWDVCIADEFHTIKGEASQVANAFAGTAASRFKPFETRRHDGVGHTIRSGRIWPMSATPVPNGKPVEVLNVLMLLGIVKDPLPYLERFCKRENSWCPKGYDYGGATNLAELNALLKPHIVRFHRGNIPPGDLPDLVRQMVPLEGFDADTIAVIRRLADELTERREADIYAAAWEQNRDPTQEELDELEVAKGEFSRGGLPPLELMSAYRAAIQDFKIQPAASWALDYLNTARTPLVMFTHHRRAAQRLSDAINAGGTPTVLCLEDDPAKRQALVDRFADPKAPPIFIGTTGSCGTGLNGLHRRTTRCAFLESEWSLRELDQAEGRIARLGGATDTGMAIAYYLLVPESLEQHIMQVGLNKRAQAVEMLGS